MLLMKLFDFSGNAMSAGIRFVKTSLPSSARWTMAPTSNHRTTSSSKLISKGRQTLRRHPTIGQLREDLGAGIRVYCIAAGRINAPHGYIYRVHEDGTVYVARLVHLARYLPDLPERQI